MALLIDVSLVLDVWCTSVNPMLNTMPLDCSNTLIKVASCGRNKKDKSLTPYLHTLVGQTAVILAALFALIGK